MVQPAFHSLPGNGFQFLTTRLLHHPHRIVNRTRWIEPLAAVRARAKAVAAAVGEGARVIASVASVGGGSLPGSEIASAAVTIAAADAEGLAERLRTGRPAVLARIDGDAVILDARTVADGDVETLARAVRRARDA